MNNINHTSRITIPIMTHRSNRSDAIKESKCYEKKCITPEESVLEKRRLTSSTLNQRVVSSKLHDRKDIKEKDADLERADLRSSKLHDRKDIKEKDADLERADLRSSKLHDRKDIKEKDADLERADLRSSKLHDRKDIKEKDADLKRADLRSSKLHDRKDIKDNRKAKSLERKEEKYELISLAPLGSPSRSESLKVKWGIR